MKTGTRRTSGTVFPVFTIAVLLILAGCKSGSANREKEPSLYKLAQGIRPDFLLGSFASGLDFNREDNNLYTDFFTHNFNIMTVGVYMRSTQPEPGEIRFQKMDALIDYAEANDIKVYLHPMFGGAEYTPDWINNGNFTADELSTIMRDRITAILTRYKGRVDYVDVLNEALTSTGVKEDGQFNWLEANHRGEKNAWMQMGMYQGEKYSFPQYLVDAFRISREVAGPDVKLILNEWAIETTKSWRADAFLQIIKNLREEGIPVDGVGMQLHCHMKDGVLCSWARPDEFDFAAFDEQLAKYEEEGIEVHITEFDIHMEENPTEEDFELQGKYYAEMLKHALASPAVKSFKTWGFTDAHSWKEDGRDGHPLMLDENLDPKPAYTAMVEMLRGLGG